MNKCIICKREIEDRKICPRCASILKDIVLGFAVLIIGSIYIISPIDAIPEMFLGPMGLTDDGAAILLIIGFLIYSFVKVIKKLM